MIGLSCRLSPGLWCSTTKPGPHHPRLPPLGLLSSKPTQMVRPQGSSESTLTATSPRPPPPCLAVPFLWPLVRLGTFLLPPPSGPQTPVSQPLFRPWDSCAGPSDTNFLSSRHASRLVPAILELPHTPGHFSSPKLHQSWIGLAWPDPVTWHRTLPLPVTLSGTASQRPLKLQ